MPQYFLVYMKVSGPLPAAVIWPFPLLPLWSAKREVDAGGLSPSCGAGCCGLIPQPEARSLLSQGATRKLGNFRARQLLAQGKGSAGGGLP